MSDEDDTFLARWSRRKSQARAEPKPDHGRSEPEPRLKEVGAAAEGSASQPADEEGEIALKDLPPIESIDATTDLTYWLRKKVPEAWKQAALSRAWAADPAISQFVGLAENSWDWNAPNGVPGFGSLDPTANIAQLLTQAIGQATVGPADPSGETVSSETASVESSRNEQPRQATPEEEMQTAPLDESLKSRSEVVEKHPEAACAKTPQMPKRRRGGGALPS